MKVYSLIDCFVSGLLTVEVTHDAILEIIPLKRQDAL